MDCKKKGYKVMSKPVDEKLKQDGKKINNTAVVVNLGKYLKNSISPL